jgi:hypothetical protein
MRHLKLCILICAISAAAVDGARSQAPAPQASPPTVAPSPVPQASLPAVAPSLAWQVQDRFRLWDAATTAGHYDADDLLSQLEGTSDAGQIYASVRAFLHARPNLFRSAHWDPAGQQYDLSYLYPKFYTIRVGLADPSGYVGQTCHWTSSVGTLDQSDLPCANSTLVTLPADGLGDGKSAAGSIAVQLGGAAPQLLVQQTLQVRDRLIVSLGDSFASGEGNPDQPSNLTSLQSGPGSGWGPDWKERWLGRQATLGVQGADWWDLPCHRSFMSQHVIAALKYSADRPHEAVTYLSFACSGAAVFNGLVAPQPQPPGYGDRSTAPGVALAQVDALARNLCPPDAAGVSTAQPAVARTYHTGGLLGGLLLGLGQKTLTARTFACGGAPGRPVDAVLLSVGGNDIGFSAVIMDAMLPVHASDPIGELVLAAARANFGKTPLDATIAIQRDLPGNLHTLDAQLAKAVGSAIVVQSDYPSPIRDETGWFCGPPNKAAFSAASDPSTARLVAVNGVWPDSQIPLSQRWAMIIDQKDGVSIEPIVVNALNSALEYHAHQVKWFVTNGYLTTFANHGWCAKGASDEDAALPDWSMAGGWVTWNPASWDPYEPRARYFRTPNDAALTELQDSPRQNPTLQALLTVQQLALLNAFDGSFHPTFQAHVIMGLGVAATLEGHLAAN